MTSSYRSIPVCKCETPDLNRSTTYYYGVLICNKCNDPYTGWNIFYSTYKNKKVVVCRKLFYREGFLILGWNDCLGWGFQLLYDTPAVPFDRLLPSFYYIRMPWRAIDVIRKAQLRCRSKFQRKQMNKRLIQHRVVPHHFYGPFLLLYLVQFVV